MSELTYAFLGNLTKSRDEQGFLHIKGIATDDTLDLDGQICDPEWLEGAMAQWFKVGNLREMHQPNAVGKATKMSQDGAKFSIEGKIVDPLTSTKIDNEVLNGLSIGIKGARIDESKEALKRAPNGIIMGGRIVEVSLVDLPANPSAVLELVKTVGDVTVKTDALGDLDEVEKKGDPDCLTCKGKGTIKDGHVDCPDCVQKTVEPDVEKKDYTDAERKDMADKGQAMPGGKFPIKTVADLKNAISTFGLAKNKPAVKQHIIARAKALGKENLIPDKWTGASKAADEDLHDPTELGDIRSGLVAVMIQELQEMQNGSDDEIPDMYQLLQSLSLFLSWWEDEADEGETEQPFPDSDDGDDMAYIAMGISPDLVKRAGSPDATDEDKTEFKSELLKSLGLDQIVTKTELEELREVNKGLKAALEDVREMAAPSQVARRATTEAQTKSAQADELETKALQYRTIALAQTDKTAMSQYVEAADTLMKRAAELRSPL